MIVSAKKADPVPAQLFGRAVSPVEALSREPSGHLRRSIGCNIPRRPIAGWAAASHNARNSQPSWVRLA